MKKLIYNLDKYTSVLLFIFMVAVLTLRIIFSVISRISLAIAESGKEWLSEMGMHSANWISLNTQWTGESAQWLWVWLVLIGISYAEKKEANLQVSFLVEKLSSKSRALLKLFTDALYLSFLIFVVIQCWEQVYRSRKAFPTSLPISNFWLYLPAVIGFVLVSICLLFRIIGRIQQLKNNKKGLLL